LFALQNNISLSIEIGNSASIQISLIQIPILVLLSAFMKSGPEGPFSLIFPTIDVFSVILSVIILNYITYDGKSNYFQGAALIIIYLIFVMAHLFIP